MNWRIIVASSDAEQCSELKKGAAGIAAGIKASGDRAEIQEARSVAEVKGLLGTGKDLVIATAMLPEHASAPASPNQPGLELIKSLQSRPSPRPCILVSDRPEHDRLVAAWPRGRRLEVGPTTDYEEDCVVLAGQLGVGTSGDTLAQACGAKGPRPSAARSACDDFAVIEVDVPNETRYATIKYVIHVDDRVKDVPTTPLGLNQKRVDELVDASRQLSERFSKALKSAKAYVRWQMDYRSLGERFYKLLDTDAFAEHLNRVKGAVDVRSNLNIRLRFSLGRSVFDGLWESICKPAGSHLMLEATITRRERDTIGSFPEARSGAVGTLNILVVGATLDDNSAPEGPDDFLWKKLWGNSLLQSLPHIESEVAAIKALEQLPYNVKVDVLSGEDRHQAKGRWSLAAMVEQHLKNNRNRYDVIHFAGHALFAASKQKKPAGTAKAKGAKGTLEDERGYLIFSGSPRPQAISIAIVADWLKNTSIDLVYLSCCRSSASRAAAEFARNSIRTTIGFSWDLDDKKAVDFTEQFYGELLSNELNVCSALSKARGDLHRKYENGDPIWASPVLLAQPSNWGNVEGVLRPPVRS